MVTQVGGVGVGAYLSLIGRGRGCGLGVGVITYWESSSIWVSEGKNKNLR